jgi:hypothetical protein
VTVEEVQSLLERYPTLLVLDGIDEVADPDLRAAIVEQINLTRHSDRPGVQIASIPNRRHRKAERLRSS